MSIVDKGKNGIICDKRGRLGSDNGGLCIPG